VDSGLAELLEGSDAREELHARSGAHHGVGIIAIDFLTSRDVIDHQTQPAYMGHCGDKGVDACLQGCVDVYDGTVSRADRIIALTPTGADGKGDDDYTT